jgi:hypothetical protein
VLADMIRVLPVALLVGVLPGWFWTRCLLASEDYAERLAYAIALSLILVPAAALAQVYLFGTGVTIAVAAASAVLVFLMGLAAYLVLGPAKGAEAPLVRPPSPPGLPALVPLAAGLALALGMLLYAGQSELGVVVGDYWVMIPIALLVVVAGAIYWWSARRRAGGWEEQVEESGPGVSAVTRYALLSVVLLLVLARGYLGPLVQGWPYPRGIDRYEHAIMTGMMMTEGSNESFMLYPPGFHLFTALISRLTGFEPLGVFPVLAPLLPLLGALALYALARRLWGWEYGVAAALFCGLLLGGTYMHFEEARYPNFIGGYFLIVLALATLAGMYASPSARGGLLLALIGSSTVLYHQIASYSLAVMLGLVCVFFLPYLLLKNRRKGVSLLASLALLFLLSVLYAWDTYDLPSLVAGMLGGSETGRGGEAVAMAIGTKPPNNPAHFLVTLSHPVLWLGLLGLMLLFAARREGRGLPDTLARLTLLAWTVLLLVGSLTSYSGFPNRFERDLGVPIALLAALALVTVLRSLWTSRGGGGAVLAVTVAAALLSVALVGTQAALNLKEAAGPSERDKDRPAPPEVAAAGRWLEEHNTGGTIVATPYLDYVPSRGMLAMGDYTGMQSYDAERIRLARDLPPFGAKPLWDALSVMHDPAGERARRVVEENDVRYVVFHKRYPGLDWRLLERHEDLYRTAFENESVVIFARRET